MLTIFETCGNENLLPGESHIQIGEYQSLGAGDRVDMGAKRLWDVQEIDFYRGDLGGLGHITIALAHVDFLPSERSTWFATKEFSRCPDRNLVVAIDYGGNLIQWDLHNYRYLCKEGDHLTAWDFGSRAMLELPWLVESALEYRTTGTSTYHHITIAICSKSPRLSPNTVEAIAA